MGINTSQPRLADAVPASNIEGLPDAHGAPYITETPLDPQANTNTQDLIDAQIFSDMIGPSDSASQARRSPPPPDAEHYPSYPNFEITEECAKHQAAIAGFSRYVEAVITREGPPSACSDIDEADPCGHSPKHQPIERVMAPVEKRQKRLLALAEKLWSGRERLLEEQKGWERGGMDGALRQHALQDLENDERLAMQTWRETEVRQRDGRWTVREIGFMIDVVLEVLEGKMVGRKGWEGMRADRPMRKVLLGMTYIPMEVKEYVGLGSVEYLLDTRVRGWILYKGVVDKQDGRHVVALRKRTIPHTGTCENAKA